jgi:hypothetical protein
MASANHPTKGPAVHQENTAKKNQNPSARIKGATAGPSQKGAYSTFKKFSF